MLAFFRRRFPSLAFGFAVGAILVLAPSFLKHARYTCMSTVAILTAPPNTALSQYAQEVVPFLNTPPARAAAERAAGVKGLLEATYPAGTSFIDFTSTASSPSAAAALATYAAQAFDEIVRAVPGSPIGTVAQVGNTSKPTREGSSGYKVAAEALLVALVVAGLAGLARELFDDRLMMWSALWRRAPKRPVLAALPPLREATEAARYLDHAAAALLTRRAHPIVIVTADSHGVGATTVAAGLASAFARHEGGATLVCDSGRSLDLPPSVTVEHLVQSSGTQRQLLGHLAALRGRAEPVVLDLGPVTTSAQALRGAQTADYAVAVTALKLTRLSGLQLMTELLDNTPCELAGCVANELPRRALTAIGDTSANDGRRPHDILLASRARTVRDILIGDDEMSSSSR